MVLGLLFLVFTPCLYAEALQMCTLTKNDSQFRDMYFNKFSDHVLLGRGYRDVKGTRLTCAKECLADPGCFSFQYNGTDMGCVLNEASALRFPLSLTEADGTLYYGPEKASFVWKLRQSASEYPGLPGRTDCMHSSPASASSECQRVNQHLCEPLELQQAFDAGYYHEVPVTDNGSWYAEPLRSVTVRSSGLAYKDLPDPVITTEECASSNDSDAKANACCALEAHPCTLAELKKAYNRGYRQPYSEWLFFAESGRDAQLYSTGCGSYNGDECYEGVVANTPRPPTNAKVLCCPLCGLPGLCCPED